MFEARTVSIKDQFSRETGKALGTRLLNALGRTPSAAWLFCASGDGVEDLLGGVHESLGIDTIIGCTTDGEISNDGLHVGSAVLGGIATDRIAFHLAAVPSIGSDCETAGRRLARDLPPTVRYVQLFTDGLTGNGCAILRGMGSVLGDEVPVCGGAAADGERFVRTLQFAGPRVLTDAAVAIGFSGDFKVGTGVRSGWSPIGIAKRVTRAAGHVLYELDGQPALDVYKRFLGRHADNLPAVGVEYPLGLVEESDHLQDPDYNMLLRATMSVDHRQGSISFAGEIPEGAMVRLTCGDCNCIVEATRKAARQAMIGLEGNIPVMAFLFSCMARKIVLGRRTEDEIMNLRQELAVDLPLLGFYTYGEFCPTKPGGPSLLHNETATVSIIAL